MKTTEELQNERDATLSSMEDRYRSNDADVMDKKREACEQGDMDRVEQLDQYQEKEFEDYKNDRQEVYDYYQGEIDETEAENEYEYDQELE